MVIGLSDVPLFWFLRDVGNTYSVLHEMHKVKYIYDLIETQVHDVSYEYFIKHRLNGSNWIYQEPFVDSICAMNRFCQLIDPVGRKARFFLRSCPFDVYCFFVGLMIPWLLYLIIDLTRLGLGYFKDNKQIRRIKPPRQWRTSTTSPQARSTFTVHVDIWLVHCEIQGSQTFCDVLVSIKTKGVWYPIHQRDLCFMFVAFISDSER